jgi:deoxycytidine triphosphate deaminase
MRLPAESRLARNLLTPIAIVLRTGMKICQLIYETVDATPDMGYRGRFSVQRPER